MGSVVGLDIGTTGVRAVETTTSARAVTVRRAHAVPLPSGTFSEGVLRDRTALVAALRQLWRHGRFRTRRAAIVIGSHPAVLIRPATVDWLTSRADMDAIVAAEADKRLPVGTKNMYVDYHVADVYDTTTEDGGAHTQASVAVVGVDKVTLEAILDCVWESGIRPSGVDVTAFALARFINQASSGPGVVDAVVNLGATTVTMSAVVDKQFVAELPFGQFAGENLTQDISLNLGISTEEAEALKLIDPSQTQRHPKYQPEDLHDVAQAISSWSTSLVRELHRGVSDMAHTLGMPVGRVWLTGGESRLPNLAPRLSAELGGSSRVAVLDPTAWVSHPEKLQAVTDKTDQDLTSAVAASVR